MQHNRENRKVGRRRTLFGGAIFHEGGQSWDCSISDISQAGVKAKTKAELEPGTKVDLRINKFDEIRGCEVMWVRDGQIGLKFLVEINPEDDNMTELFKLVQK